MGAVMRQFWTVRVDYTVEADNEDDAIVKYHDNLDMTYDGIWDVQLAWQEEEEDDE
jgi:hypothetical protein